MQKRTTLNKKGNYKNKLLSIDIKTKSVRILVLLVTYFAITAFILPSIEESKTWEVFKKAKKFVKDNIVIDFFASPYGVGRNKSEHLHYYVNRAMTTGITGTSATLAATYYTWEQFTKEYSVWRTTM